MVLTKIGLVTFYLSSPSMSVHCKRQADTCEFSSPSDGPIIDCPIRRGMTLIDNLWDPIIGRILKKIPYCIDDCFHQILPKIIFTPLYLDQISQIFHRNMISPCESCGYSIKMSDFGRFSGHIMQKHPEIRNFTPDFVTIYPDAPETLI